MMAFCLNKFPPMTMHPLFQSLNKIETRIPNIIAHVCCTLLPKILQNKTTSHTRQYRPRTPVLILARRSGGRISGVTWLRPHSPPPLWGRRRAHLHTIYPTPSLSLHPLVKTGPEQNVPHPTHHLWLPFQDRTGSAQDVPTPPSSPSLLNKITDTGKNITFPDDSSFVYKSLVVARQNVPITPVLTNCTLGAWKDFDVDLSLIGSEEMIWKTCFVLHMCLKKRSKMSTSHPRSYKVKFLKMNTSHKMLQTKVRKKLNLSQKIFQTNEIKDEKLPVF